MKITDWNGSIVSNNLIKFFNPYISKGDHAWMILKADMPFLGFSIVIPSGITEVWTLFRSAELTLLNHSVPFSSPERERVD